MSTEANKAIVRRFFLEAWNQNKIDGIDEYLSADNVHYFGAKAGRLGPTELREIIKNWRRGFPDFSSNAELEQRDLIACHIFASGGGNSPNGYEG